MPYAAAAAQQPIQVNFNGISQFPNPEQIQAIQLALSTAVGVA
jgi:2'-5' RNA ligase